MSRSHVTSYAWYTIYFSSCCLVFSSCFYFRLSFLCCRNDTLPSRPSQIVQKSFQSSNVAWHGALYEVVNSGAIKTVSSWTPQVPYHIPSLHHQVIVYHTANTTHKSPCLFVNKFCLLKRIEYLGKVSIKKGQGYEQSARAIFAVFKSKQGFRREI